MITWEPKESYEEDMHQEMMVDGSVRRVGFIWCSAWGKWHGRLYNQDTDMLHARVTGTTENEIKQAMLAELIAMRMS